MNRLQATEEKKCCRFFCDRIGFRNARGLLRVWPLMSCFASAIMNSSLMVFGFLYSNTLFRYLFRTERDDTRQNDNPSRKDRKTRPRYVDSMFLVIPYFFWVATGILESLDCYTSGLC